MRHFVWLLVAASGCAGSPSAPPPPAAGLQLHAGPYDVAPGQEINRCVAFRLDDPLLVGGIETFTSGQAHHFAVIATLAAVPPGEHDCAGLLTPDVMRASQTLFATTRAHHAVDFGEGVAGKISSGFTNLILSLHYVNASPSPVRAEAWLNLSTTPPGEVRTLINAIVAHARGFRLPAGARTSVHGRCVVDRALDVVAIGSHAHGKLDSLEIRFERGGARPEAPDYVNADWATPFIDIRPERPIHLEPGDAMAFTCTYENDEAHEVAEGPRTSDEMCAAVAVYLPDQGFLSCDTTPEQPSQPVHQTAPPGRL